MGSRNTNPIPKKTESTMPKTFSGNRPLKEIKKAVLAKGWYWNQEKHDGGSDYVTFGFTHGKKTVEVVYNTFNGRFIVDAGKGKLVTESDSHMDSTLWYSALLDFIYLPAAKKAA